MFIFRRLIDIIRLPIGNIVVRWALYYIVIYYYYYLLLLYSEWFTAMWRVWDEIRSDLLKDVSIYAGYFTCYWYVGLTLCTSLLQNSTTSTTVRARTLCWMKPPPSARCRSINRAKRRSISCTNKPEVADVSRPVRLTASEYIDRQIW